MHLDDKRKALTFPRAIVKFNMLHLTGIQCSDLVTMFQDCRNKWKRKDGNE